MALQANRHLFPRALFLDIAFDVILIPALVLVSWAFERTPAGNALMRAAYEREQGRLGSKPQQIAVVDISSLTPVPDASGKLVTPRQKLTELLNALAVDEPAAIGVDVNFCPEEDGQFVSSQDPQFFETCAKLESPKHQKIPVFVGFSADEDRNPSPLIDNKQFGRLAATIFLCEDTRRLPLWIEYGPTAAPSLCSALAAQVASPQGPTWWPEWLAEAEFGPTCEKGPAAEFLADYSALDALETHDYTVHSSDPATIRNLGKEEHFFRGKVVLLGDTKLNKALDTFIVLTRVGQGPVPGVYIHACGVNTLLTGRIHELTHVGRAVIDIGLSLLALALVTAIRMRHREEAATERIKVMVAYLFVLILIASVGVIASYLRLLWIDFYIVLIVLVAHPFVVPQLRDAYSVLVEVLKVIFSHRDKTHGG